MMLASSMRILRKAYSTVSTSGGRKPQEASARTEKISPAPATARSFSSHSHNVAFAVRLSG